MTKDSFLDTNIIINYVNFDEKLSKGIVKKCYEYVLNKKEKFILCMAVLKELQNIIRSKSKIYKVVIEKLKNESFSFEDNLLSREVPFAKKLYVKFKDKDIEELSKYFSKEKSIFEIKIEQFLKFMVDEKVIPLDQIDNELVKRINDYINNHADCKVLASAMQIQESRKPFLFVTADGADFDPNGYDFLKEQFRSNYPKEKYKFPELHNLLFVK